jgi:Chromatin associated protein KTI12
LDTSTADVTTTSSNNYGTTRKQKRHPSNRMEQPQHFGHRTMEEQVDDFLLQFIRNAQPLKEGTSTRQHRSVESDVLHIVDMVTQQLCHVIHDVIARTEIDFNTTERIEIPFRNKVWLLDCSKRTNQQQIQDLLTLDTLREIRRKYVQWIRKNPIEELESSSNSSKVIIESFLSYITTQIQQQR